MRLLNWVVEWDVVGVGGEFGGGGTAGDSVKPSRYVETKVVCKMERYCRPLIGGEMLWMTTLMIGS